MRDIAVTPILTQGDDMKTELDTLSVITCGVIDPRYDQALYGTHHATQNGRTLCGLWPRTTRSTIWFGESRVYAEEQAETVTCKRCRKAMGLTVGKSDSKVLL
jgi:hypothetical protein